MRVFLYFAFLFFKSVTVTIFLLLLMTSTFCDIPDFCNVGNGLWTLRDSAFSGELRHGICQRCKTDFQLLISGDLT